MIIYSSPEAGGGGGGGQVEARRGEANYGTCDFLSCGGLGWRGGK